MMFRTSYPSRVFQRTWSYKWIGAPVCLWYGWFVVTKTNFTAASLDWLALAVVVGCLSVALGLWLPSRFAVWPLRVMAALMAVGFVGVFHEAWAEELPRERGDWLLDGLWKAIADSRGAVFYSLPALWFAATGRLGWRRDHQLVVL